MITRGLGNGKLLTRGMGALTKFLGEIVRFIAKITTKVIFK